ncbi:MAG: hypothetical protein KC466_20270, partial [Myxococcales bacterium]|nr:hypothetical protein [Myxococcales bacterium]
MALAALIAGGCGGGSSSEPSPSGPPDPFAPQADSSEGLTNASADLWEVLEGGALRGACDVYEAARAQGTATRRARLLCGKEMYFHEGFGTLGVPTALV